MFWQNVFKFSEVYFTVLTYNLWTSIRHRLNLKKNKVDNHVTKKQSTYSPQRVAAHLANATNNEGLIEESSSLSKSLVGGSMNVCKMRVLSFCLPERVVQGVLSCSLLTTNI